MQFIIVTGMSGAGKSTALNILEDMGFYCVENLPIPLVGKFADLLHGDGKKIENAALGIDIRSGDDLPELAETLDAWDEEKIPYRILFLEAGDETLIKRFKETRRVHPLAARGRLEEGIASERERLGFLKDRADYILDTSSLLTRDLREEIERIFVRQEHFSSLYVTVLSFGFKYGLPADADLVFDVRFLPNPYYVDEMRNKTGLETAVQNYVRQGGTADIFLGKLEEMLKFLIPLYIREGKNQLVIAVGCTGGKHRSVTVAQMIYERLKNYKDIGLRVDHRDIERKKG